MIASRCLSDDVLHSLLIGTMSDDDVAVCESHLTECPDCLIRTRNLKTSDTLDDLLAQAKDVEWSGEEEAEIERLKSRVADRSQLLARTGVTEAIAVNSTPDRAPAPDASLAASTPDVASSERTASSLSPSEPTAVTLLSGEMATPSMATHTLVLQPSEGMQLGVYRLEKKLGEGGMGAVWKAFHTKLKKYVALKVLPAHLLRDAKLVSRFEREMEAVGRLDHPAIVRAMDAGEVQGTHYLVMEYVDGQDLGQLVKSKGARKVADACEMIRQAAIGLAYAHKNGLIHRDIKPSNLFLTKDGKVKILDLGLARLQGDNLAADPGAGLTGTGQVLGTPDYMAPEQWENTHTVGPACDLYALGCTLFFLLTGRAPYADDKHQTLPKKMMGHVQEPPPDLSASRTALLARVKKPAESGGKMEASARSAHDIPPELDALYQKVMAKDPAARFASADELAAALLAIIRGRKEATSEATTEFAVGPSSSHSSSQPTTVPQFAEFDKTATAGRATMPAVPLRSKKWLALGGLGTALLLSVIIITIRSKDGSTTKPDVDSLATDGITLRADAADSAASSPLSIANPQPDGWHGWPADAPKPAIAPFDAAQAKRHQEEWAKYLKIPVEFENSIGMKFRLIPPGEFLMGSTPEEIEASFSAGVDELQWRDLVQSEAPQHRVILTRPVYLGITEVRQVEYEKVMGKNPSYFAKTGPEKEFVEKVEGLDTSSHPVEGVSWNDAAEFCAKLSQQEKLKPLYFRARDAITPLPGNGYRLPSEAEWEFSCRAGTTTRYWIGDKHDDLMNAGWFGTNSGKRTHVVGELKANPFGLFDVHGNVWEYTEDGWTYYWQFQEKHAINPSFLYSVGSPRVDRGGDYDMGTFTCRSSFRNSNEPTARSKGHGFRVSLPVEAVSAQKETPSSNSVQGLSPDRAPAPEKSRALSRHDWPADAPKPAIAPFDAKQAQRHQEEWAKHLGTSVVTTNSVGAKMVLIPPGEFLMGSTDAQLAAPFIADSDYKDHAAKTERPQHRVTLTMPFLMGATEVTIGEFKKFVAATGYQTEAEQSTADPKPATFREPVYPVTDASPVSYVTWHDAVAYCRWLSGTEKVRYRLPTEAEWEYACRAGTTTQFVFGDAPADLDAYAQYTHPNKWGVPADGRLPSAFGLRGMHGGVFEWCQDPWHAHWYDVSPAVDPEGPGAGFERPLRGGQGDHPAFRVFLRSAFRSARPASFWGSDAGFRIVRELVPRTGSDLSTPQLATNDIATTLSGLFNELPELLSVKRWNVETRYPRGHGKACWSPDSKFLAAVSGRQLRIYSAPELKLVRILPEHSEFIGTIAWSPDGKRLASIDGMKIRLHNPHTGEVGPVLSGHPQPVWTIAWSADSQTLASGSGSAENIWLWSADGTPLKRLTAPGPWRLVAHPTQPLLASQDGAGKLSVWNLETGKFDARLDVAAGHPVWSQDGRLLYVSEPKRLQSWEPKPNAEPVDLKYPELSDRLHLRPGTNQLLVNVGSYLQVIDRETGTASGDAFVLFGWDSLDFSPDGNWLLTRGAGAQGNTSLQLHAMVRNVGVPHTTTLYGFSRLAWNPKSLTFATDSVDSTYARSIAHWDFGPTPKWHSFGMHGIHHAFALTWEPSGQRLLSDNYSDGKPLRLWNPSTGIVERTLDAFQKQAGSEASGAAYSPDGKLLAVAGIAKKIGLFDAVTYELKELIDEKVDYTRDVAFIGSPPSLLAVGANGASNQLWNAEKREWQTLSEVPLWWSPDGKLGLHDAGNAVRLVDRSTGATTDSESMPQSRGILRSGADNRPHWVTWSADSQRFAVETDHHELALFNRSGKFLRFLTGTSGRTTVARFAPDGSPRLAAVGDDHTLRVWNTETGRQQWCGVQLSPDEAAILNEQGEVVFGDPATVERELIYLIEYDDGRTAVLTPSQFNARFPGRNSARGAL